ncbi:hypothetical protein O6P43_032422 [Quillaja saponaria]|uniref:Uncharacterized protein n=1 Tax=Quillaja saponaria TaxID=32244 RepID=A0AAD7KMW8_QUISA|nr:hypothetical protein O6P43_032422 [Quillaja saponaria]
MFHTQFESVEKDQQENLFEEARITRKLEELNKELALIQAEIAYLQPQLKSISTKLKNNTNVRIDLYNRSTSLDSKIVYLVQKKALLESDLSAREASLVEA